MAEAATSAGGRAGAWRAYWRLAKPRVLALILFTAMVGACLAAAQTPDLRGGALAAVLAATLAGVGLIAAAAAAGNCLVERHTDLKMARTRGRPLPAGELSAGRAAAFVGVAGAAGAAVLWLWVNPLTTALTLGAFFGYTVIYTGILKRATPQNIVIGGASGAMPPVLGWAAVTGEVGHEPMLLFLIVFLWTPPHFWALALWRADDYRRSGLPMLPVTHGAAFTRLQIMLYSVLLFCASLMPALAGMSGAPYFAAALFLGGRFVWMARDLRKCPLDDKARETILARRLFAYSVSYLALLFAAMLADRLLPAPPLPGV